MSVDYYNSKDLICKGKNLETIGNFRESFHDGFKIHDPYAKAATHIPGCPIMDNQPTVKPNKAKPNYGGSYKEMIFVQIACKNAASCSTISSVG